MQWRQLKYMALVAVFGSLCAAFHVVTLLVHMVWTWFRYERKIGSYA